MYVVVSFFFFKQKTAYELRISDWSSDVCSSDLALTGWSVVPVPMLIPDHVFFWHLANRRFPAGNFIRTRETFDYIQEPDVFHDVFGHVPMLTDPVFAAYMHVYGRAGWKAMRYNRP